VFGALARPARFEGFWPSPVSVRQRGQSAGHEPLCRELRAAFRSLGSRSGRVVGSPERWPLALNPGICS
jgi:hypothetical protein